MTADEEGALVPGAVDYGQLPEVMRSLRALGSSRQGGGFALQSQFFQPLLEARLRAENARDPVARLRAFDAAALMEELEHALERIVAGWLDPRESARRALRTELRERTEEYARCLKVLGERASAALAAQESDRLAAWRAWTMQLAATFHAADRSWGSLRSVIDALPPRTRP